MHPLRRDVQAGDIGNIVSVAAEQGLGVAVQNKKGRARQDGKHQQHDQKNAQDKAQPTVEHGIPAP